MLSGCLRVRNTIGRAGRRPACAGPPLPKKWRKLTWLGVLVFLTASVPARAQTSQFLPEIDTYLTVNPLVRLSFQAKQTRESGDPNQAEIGPSIDLYLKPWIKLNNPTVFDLDAAEKRAFVFSAGYRVLPSPDAPTTNRLELVATSNFPVKGGILVSDRNRADLDWQSGRFDWRYRNKLSLQKTLTVHAYHPRVYASSEEFYESQYQKWSTTALYAGCGFPIGPHVEISPYYEHQNNTGKKPNQQLNQIGLIANLYFSVNQK